MKTLIVALLLLLCASPLVAGSWCQWDGVQGVNCQSDSRGYVRLEDGHPISAVPAPSNLNQHGFYELVNVQPTVGDNQTRDQEQWSFDGAEITRTWTVRNLTTEEIDRRIASPMPLNTYYLWKALLVKGVITQQEAATALPQELIDAYLARDRLENP